MSCFVCLRRIHLLSRNWNSCLQRKSPPGKVKLCPSTQTEFVICDCTIEEDLKATKALGLDHYEVRSYLGWYRHLTLVLLAYAFLVSVTVQARQAEDASAEDKSGAGYYHRRRRAKAG